MSITKDLVVLSLVIGLVGCEINPKTSSLSETLTGTPSHVEGIYVFPADIATREMAGEHKLQVEISESTKACYSVGETIRLTVKFGNESDSSLMLYSKLGLSPNNLGLVGNLTIRIATMDGRIVQYGPRRIDDIEMSVANEDFVELGGWSQFATDVEFAFPDYVGLDDRDYIPTPVGTYLVSAIYSNSNIGPTDDANITRVIDLNAWVGEVESNQIEICIENP